MDNHMILTVDVGGSNPEKSTPKTIHTTQNRMTVHMNQIDQLLEEYAQKADTVKPEAVIDVKHDGYTLEDAHTLRSDYMSLWSESFGHMLQDLTYRASQQRLPLQNLPVVQEPTVTALDLYKDAPPLNVPLWRETLNRLRASRQSLEKQQQHYTSMLHQELQSLPEQTVGTHMAHALDQTLTQWEQLYRKDVTMLKRVHEKQTDVMKQTTTAYFDLLPWTLKHWDRSISGITSTYSVAHNRIQHLLANDGAIAPYFASFLKDYESFLIRASPFTPADMKMSSEARQEWRRSLARKNPQECLSLMREELSKLAGIQSLTQEAQSWLQRVRDFRTDTSEHEKRVRLRRRLEDVVDSEAQQTYEGLWNSLFHRVHQHAIHIQEKTDKALQRLTQDYNQYKTSSDIRHKGFGREYDTYQAQLTRLNVKWAQWMEARQRLAAQWAGTSYWLESVEMLLQTHDALEQVRGQFDSLSDVYQKEA